MPPDDRIRILHMIEAADTVAAFIASRDRAALDQDRMPWLLTPLIDDR